MMASIVSPTEQESISDGPPHQALEQQQVDHFDLVPKTPRSIKRRTPARPLLYEETMVTEAVALPPSPCPVVDEGMQTSSRSTRTDDPDDAKDDGDGAARKESVFDRLYQPKQRATAGQHARSADEHKGSILVKGGTLPARSTKPLTVPQEFTFRTDARMKMKQAKLVGEGKAPLPATRESAGDRSSKEIRGPSRERTERPSLTVPVGPQFASEKRAAARKERSQ